MTAPTPDEAAARVLAFLDTLPRKPDGSEYPTITRNASSSESLGAPLHRADLLALLAERDALRDELDNAHREYCERLATISGECTERNGRIAELKDELYVARTRERLTLSLVDQMERAARVLNPEGQSFAEDWADSLRVHALGIVDTPQESNRG